MSHMPHFSNRWPAHRLTLGETEPTQTDIELMFLIFYINFLKLTFVTRSCDEKHNSSEMLVSYSGGVDVWLPLKK